MKKIFNILTYVFAGLALVFGVLAPIFLSDAAATNWTIFVATVLSLIGLVVCILLVKKSKLLTMIPLIALLVISSLVGSNIEASLVALGVATQGQASYETLGLLLTIAYVIALVFALKKNQKWAVILSVVYVSIILVSQINNVVNSAALVDYLDLNQMKKDSGLGLLFLSVSSLLASGAQLVYFISLFYGEEVKEEKVEASEVVIEDETPEEVEVEVEAPVEAE